MSLTYDQLTDKFDRYGALYILCSRYHSGQGSRGYRLLSRLAKKGYKPGLGVQVYRFESANMELYYYRWNELRDTL